MHLNSAKHQKKHLDKNWIKCIYVINSCFSYELSDTILMINQKIVYNFDYRNYYLLMLFCKVVSGYK